MDYITIAIIAAPVIIGYFWYAGIISKRNGVLEALSTIDVQMKMRLDLIPNILSIAKTFMGHEKTLLEDITKLRTEAASLYNKNDNSEVKKHILAAESLSNKMGQLMVNVENYPDLKSDQTMVQAMNSYNEVEAQISAARRFYNSSVTALNNSVQIFPGNVIAKIANVGEMPFFKADEAVNTAIDANKFLK